MATREYTVPVGSDLIDASGNGWQIAGITIDNPSGSWLNVSGVNQGVPPYTLGWSAPLSPTQWRASVRFVASPSGTPSSTTGKPVTVRLHDTPVPASLGFPSGAEEFQQPGRGNVQADVNQLISSEGGSTALQAFSGSFVPLGMSVSKDRVDGRYGIRAPIVVDVTNLLGSASVYPPIIISPEQPYSGMIRPIPREVLQVGGTTTIQFRATSAEGGGATNIIIYHEYYVVAPS